MDYRKFIAEAKNARKAEVVQTAAELFIKQDIAQVKMTDIARAANLGIASMYRYFGTKNELLAECSDYLWEEIRKNYWGQYPLPEYNDKCGYDQLSSCIMVFLKLFEEDSGFLKFIYNYDEVVSQEGAETDDFASKLTRYSPIFFDAVKKGKEDKTIRQDLDGELYFHTLINTYISVSQKFIRDCKNKAVQFSGSEQYRQLKQLFDFALAYAKNQVD